MYSLASVQLDPAGDNSKVSFICTYKLKLIAKPWEALGMSIRGFTHKRKKRKEERGKRWEKPIFLKNLSRSKEFYSQRPLIPGVTTISLRNPEKTLQTGDQFRLLKEGAQTIRSAKSGHTECKNRGPAVQQEAQPSADQEAFLGL